MATSSPFSEPKSKSAGSTLQLLERLQQCWSEDINWDLFPITLREGCHQVASALSMPAMAVLAGLVLIVGYSMAHSVVVVEGTDWVEPVLLWISICMPTGSGKSGLWKYLRKLVNETRLNCGLNESKSSWFFDDQSIEKLGAMMCDNDWKLLGLYDELPMFLAQMNIFRGKGLCDSHELALLLQLYGGTQWVRKTVSGEANFAMTYTGLTVGGFTQPSVARTLIELQGNAEKGFSQRFLWCIPKPRIVRFEELQKVNSEFSTSVVGLMSSMWAKDKSVKTWKLSRSTEFKDKFDAIQEQIQQVSCADELLSGMLSKSKGQILRVSAVLHVLFHRDTPQNIPNTISEEAVRAAINFVDCCLQHTSYLAGRGDMQEAILSMQKGVTLAATPGSAQAHANATFSLLLPGRVLYLNVLLAQKKFRDRGNKEDAVRGFEILSEENLGKVVKRKPPRGTNVLYEFEEAEIPSNATAKEEFMEKLMKFGVSLPQYDAAFKMDDVTMSTLESRKRAASQPPTRKSPRKNLFPPQSE